MFAAMSYVPQLDSDNQREWLCWNARSHECRSAEQWVGVSKCSFLSIPSTLHDASEAYLVDMPRPAKKCPEMAEYVRQEDQLQECVCDAFSLDPIEPPEVLEADRRILATEARDLMAPLHPDWHWDFEPYKEHIVPMPPKTAEVFFLEQFRHITETIKVVRDAAESGRGVTG